MSRTVSSDVLNALRDFDSPTISNAIEAFRVRRPVDGYASMDLRCRFPKLPPMVGYAVTCFSDSTSPQPTGPNRLFDLFRAVETSPKPAIVVIQHRGPDRMKSCFVGEVVCMCLQRLGAVGVVTDGGIRDESGIFKRAPGFQVFSPGSVVSHGTATILDVNVPLKVGGLPVLPGDLLHGDESGLLTVPHEIIEPVLNQARCVQEKESELFEFITGKSFSLQELEARLSH